MGGLGKAIEKKNALWKSGAGDVVDIRKPPVLPRPSRRPLLSLPSFPQCDALGTALNLIAGGTAA